MTLAEERLTSPLRIEEQHDDSGAYRITIVGEIDLSSVPQLQAALDEILQAGPASIGFDLSGVEFMDSSGIAVLLEAAGATPRVELVNPSLAVRRVIELSGLDSVLPVRS